jgi:hypothetical protein
MLETNFKSEATTLTRFGNGGLHLIGAIKIYGLFSKHTWNRYFFNEEYYLDHNDHM